MKTLVICGPTASGKTALAVACAEAFGGEVVSCDALLVYRGLNIGTAKPTREEMRGVPHHMIDIADPRSSFSVHDFEERAIPVRLANTQSRVRRVYRGPQSRVRKAQKYHHPVP